jgi:hypothetical protein
MKLTRRQIHIKTITNTAVGFSVSTTVNYWIFFWLGIDSWTLASGMTLLFLVLSYIRMYWLEVFFQWLWSDR